ncbi:MAG: histidine kinase dimerization/phospho-acceptor domain-containing protein, partial [Chloroflexota bacterium]
MSDSPEDARHLEARIARLEAELAEREGRISILEQYWEQWLRLISHDLRGPLTLMLGYSQSMLQSLPDGPGREHERHDLGAAVSAAHRLDKMIGQVVDAARLETHLLT